MKRCRQCGKELPPSWINDICLECARANLQRSFKENPEFKQAFMESVEELKKPENVEKMAKDTVKFIQGIQALQKKSEGDNGA